MKSGSTAVLPDVGTDVGTGTSDKLEPLYHVILLNDEYHTYEYVIEMLQKLFGMTETAAFRHTVEVDTSGTTILLTCELSKAEQRRDQIHAYGADWRLERSLGSMAAVVDPAN
jgi:ATP-dependent Clp protease adaptor protein ClpS